VIQSPLKMSGFRYQVVVQCLCHLWLVRNTVLMQYNCMQVSLLIINTTDATISPGTLQPQPVHLP